MKVLIINPPSYDGVVYIKEGRCEARQGAQMTQPISIGIIASLLRNKGFKVDFYEFMVNPVSMEKMKEIFSRDYTLAFINTTTPTFKFDKKTALLIRKYNKNIKICGLGLIVTALPEEALQDKAFDVVLRREPEYTALDICKLFTKKKKPSIKDLSKIKGISFQVDGKIFNNELRPFIENLDELPFPARDLFDNTKYIEPTSGKPFTVIRTSRGCPFNCIFCTVHSYYGRKWRTRSVENILKEVEEVLKNYKIRNFLFLSDTFTANRDKIQELCNELIKRKLNIKWVCNSRVNTLDLETAKLMKKAGCWLIGFGVESGSKRILKIIKKGISPEKAVEAAEICRKVGIKSYMYFIFGFPGETKKSIKETVNLAIKTNADFVRFLSAVPLPGSELYDIAVKNNWLKSKDWSKYDLADCPVLSASKVPYKEIKKEMKKAYLRFYLRPKYFYKIITTLNFKELINLTKAAIGYFKRWSLRKT